MNLISIITPTHNRFQQLLTCMSEVCKQTYPSIEHIVVDDASTDDTGSLPIIHLPKKVGAAKARNIGVANSSGQYITFVDDDDILYPNHCEILYSNIWISEFLHAIADKYQDGIFIGQWIPSKTANLEKRNYIPLCTVLLSRRAWDLVGGMNESLPFYQDWDLWLRLRKNGIHPIFIKTCTSKINYYKDTITSRRTKKETKQIRDLILHNFTRENYGRPKCQQ